MNKPLLFRLRHEEAQRASQRLSRQFWLGALISVVLYAGIAFCLAFFFSCLRVNISDAKAHYQPEQQSQIVQKPAGFSDIASQAYADSKGGIWLFTLGAAGFVLFILLDNYWLSWREFGAVPAAARAKKLGAKPLDSYDVSARTVRNITAEMAAASGRPEPPIFIQRKDDSINAMVIGGSNGSHALIVTQGLIKHLTRDEQQAVIAHEFGHITNEDTALYAKLSAMLSGFYALSEFGSNFDQDEQIHSSPEAGLFSAFRVSSGGNFFLLGAVFIFFVRLFSLFLHAAGRRIQAGFSREREKMADARAIQYTRQPDAFIMALKKALALQRLNAQPFEIPEKLSHYLFINYRSRQNTHPSLADRILAAGGRIEPKEIDALAYDIQTQRRHSPIDSPAEHSRIAFASSALLYPILTIANLQKAPQAPVQDPFYAVLAGFACRSASSLFELQNNNALENGDYDRLRDAMFAIERCDPNSQLSVFIAAAREAQEKLPAAQRQQLDRLTALMIKQDGQFSFYEWVYLAAYQHSRLQPAGTALYQEAESALSALFSLTAQLNSADSAPENIYQRLVFGSVPLKRPYSEQVLDKNGYLALLRACKAAAMMKPVYLQAAAQSFEAHWQTQARLSLQESHLRCLFVYLFSGKP